MIKNKNIMIGLSLISLFILFAVGANFIAPFDPTIVSDKLGLPPAFSQTGDSHHLLGTDDLGRDTLSRLIYGSRVSLFVGFLVVFFSGSLGITMGLLAGFYGGTIDRFIMRFVNIVMAFPSILLAIVVVAVAGPGIFNATIAVSIVSLPAFIRVTRASVISEKSKEYVTAAMQFGASDQRLLLKEILPNCKAPLIVQLSLAFSDGILNVAALGFLGLGARPPLPEWGMMLSDARALITSHPWQVTLPGLCILIVVLAFNLLGDGLRDYFDPKTR